MAKNIQWKKSKLDYNEINKLTPHQLAAIEKYIRVLKRN